MDYSIFINGCVHLLIKECPVLFIDIDFIYMGTGGSGPILINTILLCTKMPILGIFVHSNMDLCTFVHKYHVVVQNPQFPYIYFYYVAKTPVVSCK